MKLKFILNLCLIVKGFLVKIQNINKSYHFFISIVNYFNKYYFLFSLKKIFLSEEMTTKVNIFVNQFYSITPSLGALKAILEWKDYCFNKVSRNIFVRSKKLIIVKNRMILKNIHFKQNLRVIVSCALPAHF